ncbi:hypothetical protein RHMOL_Rhmol12G0014000 [Rhododendron molle]|uniref:Uncharacterized protein n=1 Tax=Rhododendron molle TaxID=49168 RepID=A0ACC0LD91_RHOML|nr:hypothetical protein RHMOL_Rhmol12G0014000 [Rhododendron molle]
MDVAQTGLDLNPEIRGSIVHSLLSAPSSYQKNKATPCFRASKPTQSVHTSLTPTPLHPLLLTSALRLCRFTRTLCFLSTFSRQRSLYRCLTVAQGSSECTLEDF